jgi:hypothetical protein
VALRLTGDFLTAEHVSEPRAVATGTFVISHDFPFEIYHLPFSDANRGQEKAIDSADDDKCQMENDK